MPPPLSLEPIHLRRFNELDRAQIQTRVINAVESNPEPFLARYVADPRSSNGRYVNSDLMKEMFSEYSQSAATRARYNNVVHNAAAVLAAAQFQSVISATPDPLRRTALFLTGIPGVGKTSFLIPSEWSRDDFPRDVRVIYEGSLANATSVKKIAAAVAARLQTEIIAFHTHPERALHNTLSRFHRLGRGAAIEAMARIQGDLPIALAVIWESFGDAVSLTIVDRRDPLTRKLCGWEHLAELRSEGNYAEIRQRLTQELDRQYAERNISEDAYLQAQGNSPASGGVAAPTVRTHE